MTVNADGHTIQGFVPASTFPTATTTTTVTATTTASQVAQEAIKNAGKMITETTGKTADQMLTDNVLEDIKTVLGDQVTANTDTLAGKILEKQADLPVVEGLAANVTETAKGFFERASETVSGVTASVSETVSGWTESASETVSGVTASVSETVSGWTESASETVAGVTASVSETVSGVTASVSETVSGVTASVSETVSGVTASVSETVAGVTASVSETVAGVTASVSETVSGVTASVSETVTAAQQAISDTVSPFFAEGTVLGGIYDTTSDAIGVAYKATSTVVADNALGLGVVGAAVGGVAFASSTITLLQGNAKNQPVREIAKLVAGAGLVALSVTYAASDDNERSALAITALTSAFAKSVWDAVTARSPTFYVFNLKTLTPTLPRVVVVPAKIAA